MKTSRLKAEREGRGWSQAKIAEVLGIHSETVSRWERGVALPQPYYRERLSDLFGKTIEELGLLADAQENSSLQDATRPSAPDISEQVSFLVDPAIPESLDDTNNQDQTSPSQEQLPKSWVEDSQVHEQDRHWPVEYHAWPQSLYNIDLSPITATSMFRRYNGFSRRPWGSLAVLLVLIVGLLFIYGLPVLGSMRLIKSPMGPVSISYEAEAPENTLANGARVAGCSSCSGRMKVMHIGLMTKGDPKNGTLQFNIVWKESDGDYTLTLYYLNGGYGKHLYMSVNSRQAKRFSLAGTGSRYKIGTYSTMVHLNAGENRIIFFNPLGSGPEMDRIVISTPVVPIPTQTPTGIARSTTYEAADPRNTLSGSAKADECIGCFGEKRVRYIGKGGTLRFNNVSEKHAGHYTLWIYYIDGDVPTIEKSLYISVNGSPAIAYKAPGLGNWGVIGTLSVPVSLNAGNNTIEFSNPYDYVPGINRIAVAA